MADRSRIEWTEATWNPVRGCTKVSEGCRYCYAEAFAERFRGVPGHPYENGFDLTLIPDKLTAPLQWKRPRMVFVNSMSDLFHEKIPLAYIRDVFQVMAEAHWHIFQVLTKRSKRLAQVWRALQWRPNIWMGVTVESGACCSRVRDLGEVPAAVRFISAEPLLGPLDELPVAGVDWIIVGGESGTRARPMQLDWARSLRDRCQRYGVAFFLKQLGGRRNKRGGEAALLDGRRWVQWPSVPDCRLRAG